MSNEIRIPFSPDQYGALIDSCLYGHGYSLLYEEHEYIQHAIEKLGYKTYFHKDFDNENLQHVVIVDGI